MRKNQEVKLTASSFLSGMFRSTFTEGKRVELLAQKVGSLTNRKWYCATWYETGNEVVHLVETAVVNAR